MMDYCLSHSSIEGADGGETAFLSSKQFDSGEEIIRVHPVAGAVLLFEQRLLHEGCEIHHGVKYTIRADIMYRRKKQQE
jgi:hypothetical protein